MIVTTADFYKIAYGKYAIGAFTFVAVDEDRKPRLVPSATES
jgi:acyl-CoA hydrolase